MLYSFAEVAPRRIFHGESKKDITRRSQTFIIGHDFRYLAPERSRPPPSANRAKAVAAKIYASNVSYVTSGAREPEFLFLRAMPVDSNCCCCIILNVIPVRERFERASGLPVEGCNPQAGLTARRLRL